MAGQGGLRLLRSKTSIASFDLALFAISIIYRHLIAVFLLYAEGEKMQKQARSLNFLVSWYHFFFQEVTQQGQNTKIVTSRQVLQDHFNMFSFHHKLLQNRHNFMLRVRRFIHISLVFHRPFNSIHLLTKRNSKGRYFTATSLSKVFLLNTNKNQSREIVHIISSNTIHIYLQEISTTRTDSHEDI